MSYQDNRKNPTSFRGLTGMDIKQFDALLPYFQDAHDDYFRYHQFGGKPRKGVRTPVIYRSSPLPGIGDRLYFILYYLKNRPTQMAMADRFGMGQANCNKWINTLYGILRDALDRAGASQADAGWKVGGMAGTALPADGHRGRSLCAMRNGVAATSLAALMFFGTSLGGRACDGVAADGNAAYPTDF